MGPHNNFIKNIKDAISTEISMADLVGIQAVDFSIFLYEGFSSNFENLMLFHQKPPCEISSIRHKIVEFDHNMHKHQLEYIFVLDGLPHPLKLFIC